jgi:hypothetical protein
MEVVCIVLSLEKEELNCSGLSSAWLVQEGCNVRKSIKLVKERCLNMERHAVLRRKETG